MEEGSEHVCLGKNGKAYSLNNMYRIVRELLGNDALQEKELKTFMRSEMFLEVCPDLYEAFNSSEEKPENPVVVKKEKEETVPSIIPDKVTVKQEPQEVPRPSSESPGPSSKTKSNREPGSGDEGRHKDKIYSNSDSEKNSSDHHQKRVHKKSRHHHHKKKKKLHKKKRVVEMSFSGSESSSDSDTGHKNNLPGTSKQTEKKTEANVKMEIKKEKNDSLEKNKEKEEGGNTSKIHPFYLGKMGATFEPKGKLFGNTEDNDHERERERKKRRKMEAEARSKKHQSHRTPPPPPKREAKPYSFYSSNEAQVGNGKNWKPREETEFARMQRKYKLKPMSVLCVDLTKLNSVFHIPSINHPNPTRPDVIPLKRHGPMLISDVKEVEIERQERKQAVAFKPTLNKLYCRNRKQRKASGSSTDDKYGHGSKGKHQKRRVMDDSSDVSSNDLVVKQRGRPPNQKHGETDKSNVRRGTSEWKKEQRKKALEQLSANAEKKSRATRKLPWEDGGYFESKKDTSRALEKKEDKSKEKNKVENRLGKIPKKNAPASSFQSILNQIAAANQEAAKKPPVALKIPKLSENPYSFVKKNEKTVQQGLIFEEVNKLLRSNTTVDCPLMPSNMGQLAEYTIRKLGWWFLKNEHEPADEVIVHPECHDDEIYEEGYGPIEVDDDDLSGGNVSDDGTVEEKERLPVVDPDILDEYCGRSCLECKIRRPKGEIGGEHNSTERSQDLMKNFIKPKPGCVYERPNFEAKCFLCMEYIHGQRHLGAHVRSESHKTTFRNESLKLISEDERVIKVTPTKLFTAKLVKYTAEDGIETPAIIEETENESKDFDLGLGIELEQPDSPMAVIDDGKEEAPPDAEFVRLGDLPADELSLPSLAMYDLEPDNEQLRAKICLRTNGFWTDDMEKRWVKMQEEETRITDRYNDLREKYIDAPESHPRKEFEWEHFWDRRATELEKEGKDPNNYDYGAEWLTFWFKRMQEIMKADVEREMLELKQKYGLDSKRLKGLCDQHGLSISQESPQVPKKEDSVSIPSDIPKEEATGSARQQNHSPKEEAAGSARQQDHSPKEKDSYRRPHRDDNYRTEKTAQTANHNQRDRHRSGPYSKNDQEPRKVLQAANNKNAFKPKGLTAPPPPILSKNNNYSNHFRTYGEYKSRYKIDRRNNQYDRRDSNNRNPPPRRDDRGDTRERDDRKRDYQRNPVNSNRDDKRDNNRRNNRQSSKTPSPDSEWEKIAEPQPKVAKVLPTPTPQPKPETAHPDFSLDMANVTSFLPAFSKNIIGQPKAINQTNSPRVSSELDAALAELNEAMRIEKAKPPIPPELVMGVSLGATNAQGPTVPDLNDAYSPINSVNSLTGGLEIFGTSPINTSVEMVDEEANQSVSKKIINPSSPEEGEIDSCHSSINGGSSKKKLKKSNNQLANIPLPDTTGLDKNSLGYQLLVKNLQGEKTSSTNPRKIDDESRRNSNEIGLNLNNDKNWSRSNSKGYEAPNNWRSSRAGPKCSKPNRNQHAYRPAPPAPPCQSDWAEDSWE